MKTLTTTVLVLTAAAALGAEPPDDGFYRRAHDDSATQVMSQGGHSLSLGAREKLDIHKRHIASQDNANTRFHLSVTVPYDENIGPSSYVLVVAGTAYAQTGSGASQKQTSALNFHIAGREHAERVAAYMKTPVIRRTHPRQQLRVSFIPVATEFSVGDEITATLQIENVGPNPIAFMKGGRNRAARDNQYIFSAYHNGKQVNDIGCSYHFGGLAAQQLLRPGDVFEDRISLSKWFAFAEAGVYEIHGSYYLAFTDPEDDSLRTIWEDYVAADFTVNIRKPAAAGAPSFRMGD